MAAAGWLALYSRWLVVPVNYDHVLNENDYNVTSHGELDNLSPPNCVYLGDHWAVGSNEATNLLITLVGG